MILGGGSDLPLSIRAVIVAFRVLCWWSFPRIDDALNIDDSTARKFHIPTQELAGPYGDTLGSATQLEQFYYLLPYLQLLSEARAHASLPRRIEPGSEASISLRNDVLQNRT
jgi:hypothetical protein